MLLYLVQHAEAKPESEDSARPLTEAGRRTAERMAAEAERLRLAPARVVHSGKLRARQTAEILAARLRPPHGVMDMAGLAPNDDVAVARSLLQQAGAPLLLVGHLPHLSRLTSLLVVGDPQREVVSFRMGGLVCLERDRHWRLAWILTPEIVQG